MPLSHKNIIHKRWFAYLSLSLAFYISLLVFTAELEVPGFNYPTVLLRRLAEASLWALPSFFLRKKRYLFPYILLVNLYLLTNTWYFRNYGTLMPLSSYLMIENLNGLGPSILNSIRGGDFWIICPSVCYALFYSLTKRSAKVCADRIILIAAIIFIAGMISPSYIFHKPTEYAHPFTLFKNEVLRAYKQLGFTNYWIYYIKFMKGCSEEEKAYARNFMDKLYSKNCPETLLTEHPHKNLILILVESLQSWPIGLKVNNIEITPCLNKITKQDNTLFFAKVLPQVKGGRSSDAQLILNTGLLPINEGAAASLFGTNDFIALPKILKKYGYQSNSLLCDNRIYWNQEATTHSYGFDRLFDKLSDQAKYRADEHLFKNALPLLRRFEEPFYAQLVTMSGHDAVETDLDSRLQYEEFISPTIKYNLIITEYVDRCIGNFLEDLKTCGLYDKSIIIITGDHDSITYDRYEGRNTCKLTDRFVPFIIINAPLKTETGNVIGQSDIFPSILDLMGIQSNYRGLGESVFRKQWDCAVYHTGETAGQCKIDSVIQAKKERWVVSDILIRSNYFKNHPIE